MNVLTVCSILDPRLGGGEAERSFQLTKSFIKSGINAKLLTSVCSVERLNDLSCSRIIIIPSFFRRYIFPIPKIIRLTRLIKKSDVVQLVGNWNFLHFYVFILLKFIRKPYIFCPSGALVIYGRSILLKRIYWILIGAKILRGAKFSVAITKDEMQQLLEKGAPSNKVVCIPNGVNPSDFLYFDRKVFLQTYGIENPYILFCGRLNKIKGPDILLEAFLKLAELVEDIDLVFAGPDEGLKESMMEFIYQNKLNNRVHFLGYISGQEKSNVYHNAKLLAIPSRHEAMSIVALEAGISGLPVMMTNRCGFSEISQNKMGWELNPDPNEFATKLYQVINDQKELALYKKKIRKFVHNNYTWHSAAKKYENLFRLIIKGNT